MDKYIYRPKVKLSDGTFKDAYISADNIDGLPEIPEIPEETKYFDTVIKTQAEFDEMIASSTWNDAKAVAIIGNGGTKEFLVDVTSKSYGRLTVPSNVALVQGFNGAKIHISGYAGSTSSNTPGALYGYTRSIRIKGINLIVTCDFSKANTIYHGYTYFGEVYNCTCTFDNGNSDYEFGSFYDCYNICNCTLTYDGIGNYKGFKNCTRLTNCVVKITNGQNVFGYHYCYELSNCEVNICNCNGIAYGFNYCDRISNAFASVSKYDATHSWVIDKGYGLYNCNYVNNCRVWMRCTNEAYGFYACHLVSGCEALGNASSLGYAYYNGSYFTTCRRSSNDTTTTAMWGGTISKRDDDSCQTS